jgi:hypothetical protein
MILLGASKKLVLLGALVKASLLGRYSTPILPNYDEIAHVS